MVTIQIETADADVKGQDELQSSYKPAVTDEGLKVLVPPHVKQGDRIHLVKRTTVEYVKRSNKRNGIFITSPKYVI